MPDIGSIAAAAGGLNSAIQIVKSMIGLRDTALLQEKTIELQRIIFSAQADALSAQAAQSELLEAKRALEAKIAEFEKWEGEKDKYELKQVYSGAYAYVSKPDGDSSRPVHWLCTACYERRKKSIMQEHGRAPSDNSQKQFVCPECKNTIRVFYKYGPDAPWTRPDVASV